MYRICFILITLVLTWACTNKPLNFGCDGDSITAGDQWSVTMVEDLACATNHNVGVGTATWAMHDDTQDYGCKDFAGISLGYLPTNDSLELRKRHNNCSYVHIQKFISEVENGDYPEPDLFGFALGTNDRDLERMKQGAIQAIKLLQLHFPKCRIFVCTPIQTASAEHNADNLAKIEVLNKLCAELDIPVIDCYNGVPINQEEEIWMGQGKYLRDGLHPDKAGQELMGHYIANKVKQVFRLR